MSLHRFERARLNPAPWKNGGGVTREILCWPEASGIDDFHWRASIASVAADGPFSLFPGIDRVIVLLDGAGVHLSSEDGRTDHRLETPLVPFAFEGESTISCRLIAGESSDFNIMTRRDVCDADVHVLRKAQVMTPSRHGLLFSARGAWQVSRPALDGDTPMPDGARLSAGTGLWWADEAPGWRLTPQEAGAALIAVQIWLHANRTATSIAAPPRV